MDAVHRMGKATQTQPRPIIVKFVSRLHKDDFWNKRKVRRNLRATDLGYSSENSIYINESLTPANRELLKMTREAAKQKGYIITKCGRPTAPSLYGGRRDRRSSRSHLPRKSNACRDNTFPYDELLELFGFGSLELRRKVASLMFLYKLVRGLVDDPANLAVLSYRVPSFNSRSNLLFSVPFCRTAAHASSPLYRKQDVTWNFWEIFTILRAFIFGNAATQILGGWLGACLGGSRVFGVAVALSALISLVTPFLVNTDVVNILIAIRLIEGLFAGVTYPSIIAVWSRWAPPQERTRLVTIAFSGSFFSTVVTPPVCRFIANTLGWPYIFYISGIIGLIWFVVWWTVVKDKPEDDPHISTEELKYLRDNLDSGPNDYIPKHIIYPWDKFVTSMPVWAIVVAHTCMSWGLIVLELDLPVFMRDAYNYKVDQTGLMSFLPVLLMAVLMPVAGVLADWLRNTEVLTTTQV
ncbi:hypothetical protein J6590_008645, partial [Homalodisca vitripennis]